MKRLAMATIVAVGILVASNTEQRYSLDEIYAKHTVVTEIDTGSDMVITKDFSGHEWVFTGVEDWMMGDVCTITFYNNGTDTISDDEILQTRYTGYIE